MRSEGATNLFRLIQQRIYCFDVCQTYGENYHVFNEKEFTCTCNVNRKAGWGKQTGEEIQKEDGLWIGETYALYLTGHTRVNRRWTNKMSNALRRENYEEVDKKF